MNTLWTMKFTGTNLLRLLPVHFINCLRSDPQPMHVLFCMVDHFEPGTGGAPIDVEKERMRILLDKYPRISDKHKDSDGNPPKRTWFFPPHYHRNNNLKKLTSLCQAGYGEIELHLHHGKTQPDTPDNLKETINQCVEEYSEFGIFGTNGKEKKYGFIHGNSALDNSRNGELCGVNNEIDILIETGCYADFTFPCASQPNPRKINSIYYAVDDPDRPKSYNTGIEVQSGKKSASQGLMMIQGPLFPYLKNRTPWSLRLYTPVIDGQPPVDPKRIDAWIQSRMHIKGAANWIIVKTHTHGAIESDAVLGREIDSIFNYLENRYGNSENCFLHYVSARELYNIIKAVENNEPLTTPNNYRDYAVKPPNYDASAMISGASGYLQELVGKTYA